MTDLGEFLSAARQVGRLDSKGRFTLDVARANAMLARFQQADNTFFLLKLVQAGVAARASSIKVSTSTGTITVRYFGRELANIDTSTVLEALVNQEVLLGDSPASHLAMGVNAALGLGPTQVRWTVWNAYLRETLSLTAGASEFCQLDERPWESALPGYELRISLAGSVKLPLVKMLEKCIFCPVDLEVNGRRVNPRCRRPDQEHELRLYAEASNTFRVRWPSEPSKIYRLVDEQWLPGQWLPGRDEEALVLLARVPEKPVRKGQLHLMHYGVKLESRKLDLAGAKEVYLCTAGLSLDISRKEAVADQKLSRRLDEVRRWVKGESPDDSALADAIEPWYPEVDASFVPRDSAQLEAGFDEQQRLRELVHRELSHLRLKLSPPSSGELRGGGFLFPDSPPARATAAQYLRWVRGAIDFIARKGRVFVGTQLLEGPYVEKGSGVRAAFHQSGALRSLGCYDEDDRLLGWRLELDGRERGIVTHAREAFQEKFRRGIVETSYEFGGQETRKNQTWFEWVTGWVEMVYRDLSLLGGDSGR